MFRGKKYQDSSKLVEKTKEDGTKYILEFPNSVDSCTMILEDCYVGDTLITKDNIKNFLKVIPRNNIIEVRNTAN